MPRRPHVVVYLVDTLRADALGCYGGDPATSPFLDGLAEGAALFESALSQAPWTLPSVSSLMTSRYPSAHGVLRPPARIARDLPTLPERLRAAGYRTVSFTASPFGGSASGLDRGFDEHHEEGRGGWKGWLGKSELAAFGPFETWLEAWDPAQPTFFYVHTVEPHWPIPRALLGELDDDLASRLAVLNRRFVYFRNLTNRRVDQLSPRELRRHRAELRHVREALQADLEVVHEVYRLAVAAADENLRHFVAALRRKGVWDEVVFALVSDHGEEMLDHGYWLHDQSLHTELLDVPFVLRVPGLTDEGLRVAQPVQLVDLAPTLADLVGVEPGDGWQGRSLVPLLTESGLEARSAFAERRNAHKHDPYVDQRRGRHETALVNGRWKLIVLHDLDRVELYDREADPDETRDVAARHPERVRELTAQLEAWRAWVEASAHGEAPEEALDPEQLERLRELGYVE